MAEGGDPVIFGGSEGLAKGFAGPWVFFPGDRGCDMLVFLWAMWIWREEEFQDGELGMLSGSMAGRRAPLRGTWGFWWGIYCLWRVGELYRGEQAGHRELHRFPAG